MKDEADLLQRLLRMRERVRGVLDVRLYSTPEIDRHGGAWEPSADVIKGPESFVIIVELPGVPREAIQLEADGKRLVLSGKRTLKLLPQGARFRRLESVYGTFSRAFPLPAEADTSRIEARLSGGVLEISVPLTERPELSDREIQIS